MYATNALKAFVNVDVDVIEHDVRSFFIVIRLHSFHRHGTFPFGCFRFMLRISNFSRFVWLKFLVGKCLAVVGFSSFIVTLPLTEKMIRVLIYNIQNYTIQHSALYSVIHGLFCPT